MKKWCERSPLSFTAAFFVCYMISFFALEHRTAGKMLLVHCAMDDMIPFCKYAIVPYCLWFLWIPCTFLYFFFRAPRTELSRLCLPLFGGMAATLVIYALVPTALELRPVEVIGDDIFARIVRLLYATDTPTNVCPSIHILNSVTVTLAYWRSPQFSGKKRVLVRLAAAILCVAITLSTVMLKQHSVIDVFFGALMAFVLDIAAEKKFGDVGRNL